MVHPKDKDRFIFLNERDYYLHSAKYTLWENRPVKDVRIPTVPLRVAVDDPYEELEEFDETELNATFPKLACKSFADNIDCQVSIIIPVIRPEGAERCIRSIRSNAGIPESQYEILISKDNSRIGCPKMIKKLVKKTKHDLVLFLGDDTEIEPDCIANALNAMAFLTDGWGLVGLNDGFHNGNKKATHWLASKRMLPLLDGEFFYTGYRHTRCDQELTDRAKEMGKYAWAIDAKLKHHHPIIKDTPWEEWDDDYKKTYDEKIVEADSNLFIQRERQRKWKPLVGI